MQNETKEVVKLPQAVRLHGWIVNTILYTLFLGWGYIMVQSGMMWGLVPCGAGVLLTWLASQYEKLGAEYFNRYQMVKAMFERLQKLKELPDDFIVQMEPDTDEQETDTN